jgi:hypothetical protein
MKDPPYYAYLLRLWREDPHQPWRAELEHPHTGQLHRFANPAQLFTFLTSLTAEENGREARQDGLDE